MFKNLIMIINEVALAIEDISSILCDTNDTTSQVIEVKQLTISQVSEVQTVEVKEDVQSFNFDKLVAVLNAVTKRVSNIALIISGKPSEESIASAIDGIKNLIGKVVERVGASGPIFKFNPV